MKLVSPAASLTYLLFVFIHTAYRARPDQSGGPTMQAPQAASTAKNNIYGSIILGGGVKLIQKAITSRHLETTTLAANFLVPRDIMDFQCLNKDWPHGVKLRATADAMQKLCHDGKAVGNTAENQLKIQGLRKAACLLWEPLLKSEGCGALDLMDAEWVMFSTTDLQVLASKKDTNRANDARRRQKKVAARKDLAPQVGIGNAY